MKKIFYYVIITFMSMGTLQSMDKNNDPTEKLFSLIKSSELSDTKITGQIKELINQGADLKSKNRFDGTTPLISAISRWDDLLDNGIKTFNLLIDSDDLDAQDVCGLTALMHASTNVYVSPRIIEMLLQKGANPSIKSGYGTALEQAILERDKLLNRLGTDTYEKGLKMALQNQNEKILLLERFCNE